MGRIEVWLFPLSCEHTRKMKRTPRTHVSDGYSEADPQHIIGVHFWSAKRKFRFGFPNARSGKE